MERFKEVVFKSKRLLLLFMCAFSLTVFGLVFDGHAGTKGLTKEDAVKKMAKLSIPFIENRGQVNDDVTFYAKTLGGTLFVTNQGELIYSLPKYEENAGGKEGLRHKEKAKKPEITGGIALKERLIGGNVKGVKGEDPAQARVSYFMGNDPDKWSSDISTYGIVSLGEVYEGIELKLKAYGKNVEKLFYVRPGAKAEEIALSVEGAKGLKVDEKTGELAAETEFGDVRFTRPIAYYLEEPVKRIDVSYKVEGNTYTFALSEYDRTKTIVIDPLLASTFIGGSGPEGADSIALDSEGNVYVTGSTWSTNYPTTTGAYDSSLNGGTVDGFISKLDSSLTTLLASTFFGGSTGADVVVSITIDSEGNVYVAGLTHSSDFPTPQEAYDITWNGGPDDAFVSKFNSSLTTLLSSTYLGGTNIDRANSIALDSIGNVYVTGYTSSTNYPTTQGAYDTSFNGVTDVFVSKLNNSLNQLLASTFIGGTSDDYGFSIALDNSGNVFVTGNPWSSDYPTTQGAYDTSFNGVTDVFVSKLNNSLSQLLASTFIGGASNDFGKSIAIDSSGNVFVAGVTNSTNYPTTQGAYDTSHHSSWDVFVSKLNNSLSELLASTFIGGSSDDQGNSIALDNSGNVFVTGLTNSSDYPTTQGAYDTSHHSSWDVFVSKLNNSLSELLASTFIGGSSDDQGNSIALDNSGNVFVTGLTNSSDYPTTQGAYDTSHHSSWDVFVSKLDANLSATVTQYTLTVATQGTGSGTLTSSDGGINCGSDCSESYSSGTSVTLTATPSTGSTFAGWGGDCSSCGTNTACGITMNADKTCTATFTAMQANGPDLTGQWQSLTEQRFKGLRTRSGYLLRGALKISNMGNRDANGQFRVSYYLSNDGTTLGTPIGSTNVCVALSRTSRTCQLKPATSVTLSFSYASTQSLKGNYVIAVIDEANNISETNENNNRASAQIQ